MRAGLGGLGGPGTPARPERGAHGGVPGRGARGQLREHKDGGVILSPWPEAGLPAPPARSHTLSRGQYPACGLRGLGPRPPGGPPSRESQPPLPAAPDVGRQGPGETKAAAAAAAPPARRTPGPPLAAPPGSGVASGEPFQPGSAWARRVRGRPVLRSCCCA